MFEPLETLPRIDTTESLAGGAGVVDLWWYSYTEPADRGLERLATCLTADEWARHDRFVFPRDRFLFLATRVLSRHVLSRYAPVAPAAWRFASNAHGKPCVISPHLGRRLCFNLSNSHGLVACAVSVAHVAVGVDVELVRDSDELVLLWDQYFSPQETRTLRAVARAGQTERFFAYWTLKESYIKARGLGLALPLDRFSFLLDDGPAIGIAFDPALGDAPARWQFSLLRAGQTHLAAVGVDSGGAPLSLRAERWSPETRVPI